MDSTERKTLVEALISYGLNEYEAKAYLALLQFGPAVAGEISRRSGIPRPRVYDTLQRLIDASLVSESDGNPKGYSPLPLDDFLRNMSAQSRRRQDLLKANLGSTRPDDLKVGVFHLFDEARIKERMEDLISVARSIVSLAIPVQDLDSLQGSLERAVDRGIEIEGSIFGPADIMPGWRCSVKSSSEARTENGGRRFMLCRDGEELLLGHLGGSSRSHAVLTRNKLLIEELTRSVRSDSVQAAVSVARLVKS